LNTRRKLKVFPTPCIKRPDEGIPLEFGIGARQGVPSATMMGLPDGRKSFKTGLVVLIQYRLWQTASQPDTLP